MYVCIYTFKPILVYSQGCGGAPRFYNDRVVRAPIYIHISHIYSQMHLDT